MVSPAPGAAGAVTVIVWPLVATCAVSFPPPAMFACTKPAALLVVFCGAVQFAGTVSLIAPLAERPPAPTVYVRITVLLVVPASVEVGLIEAEPEPSADAVMSKLELVGFVSEWLLLVVS